MVEINKTPQEVVAGDDSIVIRRFIDGIEGGRALDVTAFASVAGTTIVKAGAIIIKDTDGKYKPAPIKKADDSVEYDTIVASTVVGILTATIDASITGGAIMTAGRVNKVVMPYGGNGKVADVASALPHIAFVSDAD